MLRVSAFTTETASPGGVALRLILVTGAAPGQPGDVGWEVVVRKRLTFVRGAV